MQERLIRLPWPPSKTSANASGQGDWRGRNNAANSYKEMCWAACREQKLTRLATSQEFVDVSITYHPPREGRVDWDNLAGRAKKGWDAVADAIGVDDGRWWPVHSHRGEKVKGGCVLVHVRAAE